jgi:alkylation response protein AidB-like acyl-CoA dehydrogenase
MRRVLSRALADRRLFGVWNTESTPGVRLRREAGAWRLSGAKTYATGCGHLDFAIVTAELPDGGRQMLLLNVGAEPGRADASAWRTSGMRATVSGRYDVSGMPVDEGAFLGRPDDYEREPMFTAGAWRFTAVQLGAIQALVGILRTHMLSLAEGGGDPRRARFAKAVAAARTAYLWVGEAARRAELDPGPEAVAFVQLTRGVVEEAGLAVIEAVQRGIGTRAFFTDGPADRIMRDLALYLRQPAPDLALDRAARAWLETDCWGDDPWW